MPADAVDSDVQSSNNRTTAIVLADEHNYTVDGGYFFSEPGIHIEKSTNGQDADTPTRPVNPEW